MTHSDDEKFMALALEEATRAAELGEVPIGAVVVHDGEVIARAGNRRETDADPAAHAEFSALMRASRVLGRWRLTGCTVYVTLEPCLMCAGLMVNSRIDRCVFGAPDPKGGAVGTLYDVSHDARLNHEFEVEGGVLEAECAEVLRAFFKRRRAEAKAAKLAARVAQESAVALPEGAEPPLLAGECTSHIDGLSVQGPALP
ncbi:MAG: tRNA adenosine(34) deaminase TadA [Coriobacteriaceae bacterium]|nr:tRNA adenosine(34) deaminase TadA [Coriobacteriaceae bacterium]MDD7111916.1 tRNA adenosine(34) deaminase TadA [Coriobacteriaceae bacterium]